MREPMNLRHLGYLLLRCLVWALLISGFVGGQATEPANNDTTLGEPTAPPLPVIELPGTNSPTRPPTLKPTITPVPTAPPTPAPTVTIAPSHAPTATFSPSDSPTVSPMPSVSSQPSEEPSSIPSDMPSESPSTSPSETPTISLEPTISNQPTITPQPTKSHQPSDAPSSLPSDRPTPAPTVSVMPSQIPSDSPSQPPTISMAPSDSPSISNMPSVSMKPSALPSVSPTNFPTPSPVAPTFAPTPSPPTEPPTPAPTGNPTSKPTLTIQTVSQSKIFMVLNGVPAPLDLEGGDLWAQITENHMMRFYQELNELDPGLWLGVNVSAVYDTLLRKQTFTLNPPPIEPRQAETPESSPQDAATETPAPRQQLGRLELEYSQTIDYGIFDPANSNEDLVRNQVFVLPFENDAQAYVLDLILAFDLDNWVTLEEINVGPTPSPTSSPTNDPDDGADSGLSSRGLRTIAACIVLSAILVAGGLFWHGTHKSSPDDDDVDGEAYEYDNAGNAGDWINPYGSMSEEEDTSQAAGSRPQDRSTMDTIQTSQSMGSTVVAATSRPMVPDPAPADMDSRSYQQIRPIPTLAPMNSTSYSRSESAMSSSAPTRHIFATPPRSRSMDRHARYTSQGGETDITDLTFSEMGDRANEVGDFSALNAISDEPFTIHHDNDEDKEARNGGGGLGPFSPMHIPEGDNYGTGASVVKLPPRPGLGRGMSQHMSGFQMQVEDLE